MTGVLQVVGGSIMYNGVHCSRLVLLRHAENIGPMVWRGTKEPHLLTAPPERSVLVTAGRFWKVYAQSIGRDVLFYGLQAPELPYKAMLQGLQTSAPPELYKGLWTALRDNDKEGIRRYQDLLSNDEIKDAKNVYCVHRKVWT